MKDKEDSEILVVLKRFQRYFQDSLLTSFNNAHILVVMKVNDIILNVSKTIAL